jgi:tripartite-type tricarboxylate transporter receptor subunit TctC
MPGSLLHTLLAIALAVSFSAAAQQSYPNRPIRLVVPYAPGGATDAMARVYAQKFQEAWGQPMLVENRAGAGGNIGAEVVAKSPPDGYTILLNTSGQAIAPGLYKKLNYDPLKDLVPITQLVGTSLVLVTSPQLPVNSPRELVALARAQPGKLNFGSTGIGSAPHLNGEMFKSAERLDVTHVPYKGDAQVFPALLANEVQFAFVPPQSGLAIIKSGKVKALAVTGSRRSSSLPDLPTLVESGVPGVEYNGWVGLFASAGTPREVVQKIADEAARMLHLPEVMKYNPGWGVDPVGSTPDQFAATFRAEVDKFAKLIREAKIPQAD